MKLIYITENINAVFYSQVVVLINKLVEKKYFEEVYLAIGLRDCKLVNSITGLNSEIKLLTFKTYPMYPICNTLTEKGIFNLFKSLKINNNFIIHTRIEFLGELAYNSYFKINKNKPNLLIDIRGSLIEEIKIYGKMNPFLKFLKLFNHKSRIKKVLNNVDFINVVSDELKKYIENLYKFEKNISVIPTISGEKFYYNENDRINFRKKLNISDDDIIFIFSSGSTQAWQNDNKIVETLVSKGYKVLMLTKKKYDNPNIISMFVPYDEVPKYLNAADIGIIIRENDIVNNVAAPIKFCEYISCGLPVIANESVKIINNILTSTTYGNIQDLEKIDDILIKELIKIDRYKISKFGINTFGINSVVDNYVSIYERMGKRYE